MSRKRLGGIVWTARRQDGPLALIVQWMDGGDMHIGAPEGKYPKCRYLAVAPRDVRRLLRLMQRALDWRYGKRRPKSKAKEINIGAWIDQDT